MSSQKKKTPAEELLESLLNDVGSSSDDLLSLGDEEAQEYEAKTAQAFLAEDEIEGLEGIGLSSNFGDEENQKTALVQADNEMNKTEINFEPTQIAEKPEAIQAPSLFASPPVVESQAVSLFSSPLSVLSEPIQKESIPIPTLTPTQPIQNSKEFNPQEKTFALESASQISSTDSTKALREATSNDASILRNIHTTNDSEKTVAVTGFQIRPEENLEDRVKVSVGKQSRSSGFASWGNNSVDGHLNQAENLKMAQEKIINLENENERLRRQNEELIAASEIIKERSDLLTAQLTEIKNDQDGLEQSFKNEMTLLKNHLSRKDAELQRAQFKVDELESKLKFDMKKIRVRERELENRLELVRAEKNAISKNKDEQILDLRRKMDVLQMEVDSYRQKCVELNKQIENSQDSFKRTTRALRIAMANLELQEENKVQLKKAE